MQVRQLRETDAVQLVDLMYEMAEGARYVEGHAPLNQQRVVDTIMGALRRPYMYPCFVTATEQGYLSGVLYGYVEDALFGSEKWYYERAFYIRPEFRTYPLMRAYLLALQDWCSQEGVCRIEFGNAFAPSARLAMLYKRMGFEIVNTIYAKRVQP